MSSSVNNSKNAYNISSNLSNNATVNANLSSLVSSYSNTSTSGITWTGGSTLGSGSATNLSNYYALSSADTLTEYNDIMVLSLLGKYLKEDELDDILSKILERDTGMEALFKDQFRWALCNLVKIRHFSEDFLMKYYPYLSVNAILKLHTPDVSSQNYARLALLIMNDDSKKC